VPLKSGFKWHLKLSNVLAIRPWSWLNERNCERQIDLVLCVEVTVQFCVQDHLKLVGELSEQRLNHLADLVEHLVSTSSLSLTVFKVRR